VRLYRVPSSSLEERIRALTAQAVQAQDPSELETILSELRGAIGAHLGHIRAMVAEHELRSRPDSGSSSDQ
jgi:hypothetical protein